MKPSGVDEYRPGLFVHRLASGLWELRTHHRTLGVYETKRQARSAKCRLLRRGRRCYNASKPRTTIHLV